MRLINAAYRVEDVFLDGDRTNPADLAVRLSRPNAAILVIEGGRKGRLAGAVYMEVRGSRGYFGLLAVDPQRQGEGLGRLLVQAVERHCRTAGCTDLDLDTVNLREELPAFYTRLGFTRVGTAPFHPSRPPRREAHLILWTKTLRVPA